MRNENNNEIKNNTGHPNLGKRSLFINKIILLTSRQILYFTMQLILQYDVNIMLLLTKVQYCCFY